VSRVSHAIDRIRVSFDEPNLVANAGLLLQGTVAVRLQLERLVGSPAVATRGREAMASSTSQRLYSPGST